MGRAKEQEIRITAFGLIALVVLASFLTVATAMLLVGPQRVHLPRISVSQDAGGTTGSSR
jgi:hypothetical protein